jgi:curved DNA-binding protein CbpA
MQGEQDYYRLLDVAPDASTEQIREAYRRLAFQYHPDRNPAGSDASKKMQEINEAYATLMDPVKRREYDLPRGYRGRVPKFRKGSKVKVSSNSASPYRDRNGIVDKEPVKDAFRFWYMVRFESKGLPAVSRFAEEELEAVRG